MHFEFLLGDLTFSAQVALEGKFVQECMLRGMYGLSWHDAAAAK